MRKVVGIVFRCRGEEVLRMFADDYELCQRRLKFLVSCFWKDPLLFQEYNKVMKEQLASGVLEKVTGEPPEVGRCFYLPHDCEITKLLALL